MVAKPVLTCIQAAGKARWYFSSMGLRKEAKKLNWRAYPKSHPAYLGWWKFEVCTPQGHAQVVVIFKNGDIYAFTR